VTDRPVGPARIFTADRPQHCRVAAPILKPWIITAAALGAASGASPAHATSVEVTGDVVAQGYEVRSPWGDAVLSRRRLGTTLGLFVYDLQGDHVPLEEDYSVRMLVRLDADYGISGHETQYSSTNPTRFVPGLERTPVDLLYGYVEGRRLWGGWFGFRLGRQYVTDALGWWSFDGASVNLTTPVFVRAELYGGLEQRGGLPLSSSRYERPGTWRGDRSTITEDRLDYPSFQEAAIAPALGFAVESDGPNYLHGKLSYRRVYNTGEFVTGAFPAPNGQFATAEGTRLSQERLGYAGSAFLPDVGGVRGGFVYDFYGQLVSQIQGAVDVHLGDRATVGVDFDYFVPTFDADSIWNWFTHSPVTTMLGRASVRPLERLELSASGGARLWMVDGNPSTYAIEQCGYAYPNDPAAAERCRSQSLVTTSGRAGDFARQPDARETSFAPDLLLNAGAGYRWGSGSANLRGMLEQGIETLGVDRGRRGGGELSARQALDGGRYWLGGAVSAYDWSDPLRSGRDATSLGYLIAPEYVASDFARLRVEWEHDMNRLVGQRFRLVGMVQLRVLR
jgi:hypothetical protein